jgi:hypothetical protein
MLPDANKRGNSLKATKMNTVAPVANVAQEKTVYL